MMTYEEVVEQIKNCDEGNGECSDCPLYNDGCSGLRAVLIHEKQLLREFVDWLQDKGDTYSFDGDSDIQVDAIDVSDLPDLLEVFLKEVKQ